MLCGCNPIIPWGLLRKPGLGTKPQVEILGGDGVSERRDSALALSSGAAALPEVGMEEEDDREVTSASGDVCTLGVSTAKSASMRKFLDFSIGHRVRVPVSTAAVGLEEKSALFFPRLKSYDVIRSARGELSLTLNPGQMETIGAAVWQGGCPRSAWTQQRLPPQRCYRAGC